jgi:Kdo2-lipid IVA lauroyltransferase/acyltransferase
MGRMEKPRFHISLLHPRHWLMWSGITLWWLISQLPYPWLRALARLLAPVLKLAGKSRRRIVQRNLELCFPQLTDVERSQLLEDNFFSTSMALFEIGMAWFWPQWRLRRLFTIEGLEHLQTNEDEGVILMAMHFTTLDIGGAFVNMSASIDAMYRPHKNPVFDYVQRKGRERHNPATVVIPRDDVRSMIRALKRGRTIWYAPDQDYGPKQSVFAPFFGVEAATVTATAKFARLGKARVVPFVQTRLPGNKGYKVTIYPALQDYPQGDERDDAQRINSFIEERINEQPGQYLWAHRRFKTRPPGETSLYKRA